MTQRDIATQIGCDPELSGLDLCGAALLTQAPPGSLLRLMAREPAAGFGGLWGSPLNHEVFPTSYPSWQSFTPSGPTVAPEFWF